MALSANVRVTPGVQKTPDLIDLAWQGVRNHSETSQGMYEKPQSTSGFGVSHHVSVSLTVGSAANSIVCAYGQSK